jgi:hypothetical protein
LIGAEETGFFQPYSIEEEMQAYLKASSLEGSPDEIMLGGFAEFVVEESRNSGRVWRYPSCREASDFPAHVPAFAIEDEGRILLGHTRRFL